MLEQLAVFRGLPDPDLDRVKAYLGEGKASAWTNLMSLEQPGETVYFLLSGTVRVQVEQEDGTTVILGFLGAGEIVGEMSLLDSSGRSATVVATEPVSYYWMDRERFRQCLLTMPRLGFNLLQIMSRRLRHTNRRVQAMARLDVASRLVTELTSFAETLGEPVDGGLRIPLRLTQSDLASVVGASRERVNQTMVELRQRGLISIDGRYRVTVKDPESLAQSYGVDRL